MHFRLTVVNKTKNNPKHHKDGAAEKKKKTIPSLFHGSPNPKIRRLRKGSFVTTDPEIARQMGMFNKATLQTWDDGDLSEPHVFGNKPKFKKGRKFTGKPVIYVIKNFPENKLDRLGNPFEHVIKRSAKVTSLQLGVRNSMIEQLTTSGFSPH